MEVTTLLAAHNFDDLEADIKALIEEVNAEEGEAATHGLLHLASEASIRFEALKRDYIQWRKGTKISPQAKVRFSRHVEIFHRLLTNATRTLKRVGHSVDCPEYPHTPIPVVFVTRGDPEEESSTTEEGSRLPASDSSATGLPNDSEREAETSATPATPVTPEGQRNKIAGPPMMQHLSPATQLSENSTLAMHQHFVFPPTTAAGDVMRRRSVSLTSIASGLSDIECLAKEAELEVGEERERRRSASRMEGEERLKREADRRAEEDEEEERELLRKAEEVRRQKELNTRRAQERLEEARREEKERLESLKIQNDAIRRDLQKGRMSHSPTFDSVKATDGREKTSAVFQPAPNGVRPTFPHFSPHVNSSLHGLGENKPEIHALVAEMSVAFKAQSEMIKDLSAAHLQLQQEMKEVLRSNAASQESMTRPLSAPTVSSRGESSISDTLLAHFKLPDSRPPPEERWKGGRDVRNFLKRFKSQVEDLPGITSDMVWNELPYRTSGLALRLLDPFKDDEAGAAVEKAKQRYLRIWARTSRDIREILAEVVRGAQVKATDFNALIGLVAELEDHRRQAALNHDEDRFDEAETLMAIVAARLTCLEVKWSKHALKKRNRNEEINFGTLIAFIEDEAAALEEPEGVKARARAHELVGLLQRQSSSKRLSEKDKWGGKGGRFEPLIINAAQYSNSSPIHNVPPSQVSPTRQPPRPVTPPVAPPPARNAWNSASSSLSSQAAPFVPAPHAQFSGRERRGCAACKAPHGFYACNQYLSMDSEARRPFAAKHRVCFKCANSVSHGWRQCTQQNMKCFWCHSRNHHSTLHVDQDASPEPFTDARLAGGPYMMGAAAAGVEINNPSMPTPPPTTASPPPS